MTNRLFLLITWCLLGISASAQVPFAVPKPACGIINVQDLFPNIYSTYSWNFGSGAILGSGSITAHTPPSVEYPTSGVKTISLTYGSATPFNVIDKLKVTAIPNTWFESTLFCNENNLIDLYLEYSAQVSPSPTWIRTPIIEGVPSTTFTDINIPLNNVITITGWDKDGTGCNPDDPLGTIVFPANASSGTYTSSNGLFQIELTTKSVTSATYSQGFTYTARPVITQQGSVLVASTTGTWLDASQMSIPGYESTNTYPPTVSGTYYISVTYFTGDGQSCTIISAPFNYIAVNNTPDIALTATPPTCFGATNGTIATLVTNGTAPFTYLWSNGATTADVSGLGAGTYTVTVTGQDAQTNTGSALVSAPAAMDVDITTTPTPNPTATASASGGNSPYTYLWNTGETNTTISINAAGSYTVTATDVNGCSVIVTEQILIVSNTETQIIVGKVVGEPGDTLLLPIILKGSDCPVILGIRAAIGNFTPGIFEVIGTENGILSVSTFNPDENALICQSSGGGIATDGDDTLCYLKIKLIGNEGDSTAVSIATNPVPFELVCGDGNGNYPTVLYTLVTGQVKISRVSYKVTGTVRDRLNMPVKDVTVRLFGIDPEGLAMPPQVSVTDQSGTYTFTAKSGSDLFIFAQKDTLDANGVSLIDAVLFKQWLIGLPTPQIVDASQLVAANVNCDDKCSLIDLILLEKFLITPNSVFDPCDAWEIVPADHVWPSPTPYTASSLFSPAYPVLKNIDNIEGNKTADFLAIKTGDLNTSADPQQYSSGVESRGNETCITLYTTQTKQDHLQELSLRCQENIMLNGTQLLIHFDAQHYAFVASTDSEWIINDDAKANGLLRLIWISPAGNAHSFAQDEALLSLQFQILESGYSEPIQITMQEEDQAAIVTKNEELSPCNIVLVENNSVATEFIAKSGFMLFQNVPNPATDITSIDFELPSSAVVEISITNILGQVLKSESKYFEAGRQQITFDINDLAPGNYLYSMKTKGFTETKKMVKH